MLDSEMLRPDLPAGGNATHDPKHLRNHPCKGRRASRLDDLLWVDPAQVEFGFSVLAGTATHLSQERIGSDARSGLQNHPDVEDSREKPKNERNWIRPAHAVPDNGVAVRSLHYIIDPIEERWEV